MASASDIVKRIKDEEIDWVDLRFTDPKGKWQHLSMVSSVIDEDALEEGLMFDGSSIAGWKTINESDMILKPDIDAVYIDPFSATPMMIINCDIVEPSTGELYGRDPRSTAKRAEAYLKTTGIGDTVYVGPEAEFFMFDDVRFEDLETNEEVMAVPGAVREHYLKAIGALVDRYRRELGATGIDYQLLNTNHPLELALMSYLSTRSRAL